MATDGDMLEIVNSLYTAALGDIGWDPVLCRLADFCGAENAALVRANQRVQSASVAAPRADAAVIAAYNHEWWVHDPTVKATQAAPVGHITSLDDTGRDVFYNSLFHNEFWSNSRLGAERFAVNLSLGDHHFASCVLHAPAKSDRLDRHAKTRLAALTPHLIRATEIQDRLAGLAFENAMLNALESKPHQGVMVVDSAMRILFADPSAEALLAQGVGVRFRHGAFGLQNPRANALLQHAVRACGGAYTALPDARSVPWNREPHAPALTIEAVPWSHASTSIELTGARPAAILCIHQPETAAAPQAAPHGSSQRTSTSSSSSQARATLLSALKQDINDNFRHADISLSWLAKRHQTTPRRIRDLFYADNTSFTEYLLNTRLDHAHVMLTDAALAHLNVAAIAFDCGFGDISWFHHTFRRRFHLTPAQVRGLS